MNECKVCKAQHSKGDIFSRILWGSRYTCNNCGTTYKLDYTTGFIMRLVAFLPPMLFIGNFVVKITFLMILGAIGTYVISDLKNFTVD